MHQLSSHMLAGILTLVRRAAQGFCALAALATLLSSSALAVGSVMLAWDASTAPGVAGYNVYYGSQSRTYTNLVSVGNVTSAVLTNLAPGAIYYFAATTVNTLGLESDYSLEVSYAVPPEGTDQPPTLDPIANVTLIENSGLQTVALTGISSGTTNPVALSITAATTDSNLLPGLAVTYNSPNTVGTLTITPGSNLVGSATVTITVNNGQPTNNLAVSSFVVTILSTNAPFWNMWWQNSGGYVGVWLMDQTNRLGGLRLNSVPVASGWQIVGTGDFLGDGNTDLLWQSTSGWLSLWFMEGTNCTGHIRLNNAPVDTNWRIVATGDFDGNGSPDLVWHHTAGWVALWLMDHTNTISRFRLNSTAVDTSWQIVAAGKFDGTTNTSLLWQNTSGYLALWRMSGTNFLGSVRLNVPRVGTGWRVVGAHDILGDGNVDLLWQNLATGRVAYWLMNGTTLLRSSSFYPANLDPTWRVVGAQ